MPEHITGALCCVRWLQQQAEPWLLVFDNVEYDPASQQTTFPAGCQQLPRHHVLITSRYRTWGGLAEPIELTPGQRRQGPGDRETGHAAQQATRI